MNQSKKLLGKFSIARKNFLEIIERQQNLKESFIYLFASEKRKQQLVICQCSKKLKIVNPAFTPQILLFLRKKECVFDSFSLGF